MHTINKLSEREIKDHPVYNYIKNNKIPVNKPAYRGERPVLGTVRNWWKKLKMTETDGEIYHVLGLEELILLKSPYYPTQSTDSM